MTTSCKQFLNAYFVCELGLKDVVLEGTVIHEQDAEEEVEVKVEGKGKGKEEKQGEVEDKAKNLACRGGPCGHAWASFHV